tara:strand:- start:177 stop:368 length:192 start_codon:yes stop_codon:yes gene_type:complete
MKPKLVGANLLAMCTGFAICGVVFYALVIYSDLVDTVKVEITKEVVCAGSPLNHIPLNPGSVL